MSAGIVQLSREEALPCPFCGSGDNLRCADDPDGPRPDIDWAIVCDNCTATGPLAPDEAGAVAAWNRRAVCEVLGREALEAMQRRAEAAEADWQAVTRECDELLDALKACYDNAYGDDPDVWGRVRAVAAKHGLQL